MALSDGFNALTEGVKWAIDKNTPQALAVVTGLFIVFISMTASRKPVSMAISAVSILLTLFLYFLFYAPRRIEPTPDDIFIAGKRLANPDPTDLLVGHDANASMAWQWLVAERIAIRRALSSTLHQEDRDRSIWFLAGQLAKDPQRPGNQEVVCALQTFAFSTHFLEWPDRSPPSREELKWSIDNADNLRRAVEGLKHTNTVIFAPVDASASKVCAWADSAAKIVTGQ